MSTRVYFIEIKCSYSQANEPDNPTLLIKKLAVNYIYHFKDAGLL